MDDFREWLSDNLRYFMLGGAILIIVVVLFLGIRACSGSNKGNSGDGQKTTSTDQGNVPSSPTSEGESDEKKEDANPMETADSAEADRREDRTPADRPASRRSGFPVPADRAQMVKRDRDR